MVVIPIVYKFIGTLILNVPYSKLKPYKSKNANTTFFTTLNISFILSPINYILMMINYYCLSDIFFLS